MPTDPRTDEQLVASFYANDKPACEILLDRYYTPILTRLLSISSFRKDENHLFEIRQVAMITVSTELCKRSFRPAGPGSVQGWIYKIVYYACLNADKKRRKDTPNISAVFTEEKVGAPDDLLIDINPRDSEVEQAIYKLKKILPLLTGEEVQLMTLVGDNIPYAEILKHRLFKDKKYTIDILTKMVHNIRQRAGEMKTELDPD